MNLEIIRNIKENQKFLINGVIHICTMSLGYKFNPNMSFRFTNPLLKKEERHTVYNEYYFKCKDLHKEIKSNKIDFIHLGFNNKDLQLKLF